MKKFCGLLILSLFSYVCSATVSVKLQPLLDEIWQYNLSISPIFATSQGVHDFDNKLADMSPDALKKQDSQFQDFLKKLSFIDETELNRNEQISLLIQQRNLQNNIDEYRFNAHYMPLTSESSFHSSLAFLPRSSRFKTLVDYQNYLERLEQFPTYFEQQINWMRKGIQTGFIQPKVVLQGFEDSVKGFIHDSPEDSVFYAPFHKLKAASIDSIHHQKLMEEANKIITNRVFSAYQKFFDFLITEYIPKGKTNIAAISLPNGAAYYQNQSDFYTTTQMSVDEIHTLGLGEVKRIRAEMQTVINQLKYDGNINQFIQYLRTDKKFYAQTADELIKQASYIAKKMDAKLPQLFNFLPRTPYGVEPVPENIAPKYTTGRYISPANDSQPGFYWVNTFALDKRPLYALTALTLHEAVPGHHLQISLSREMTELPDVRRYTYISAFGEGWGLYAEFLGKEVQMYDDPYDEFGRLSYEMWRACRLVVDTGMHIKGWSRQKSINYMLNNTALSEHNVTTEIDRYISWPAQALSYKIGELTIKRLRKQAEEALGANFDLREFHQAVLEHGSIPLSVLDENIQLFIQQQ
ncbi:DUF885 domain-containing protein [bacterium]|nr:DUF885 domain-containing protein [bacterium]